MESCVSRGSPTFLYFNFLLSVTRRWVIQMSKLQMTVKCVCNYLFIFFNKLSFHEFSFIVNFIFLQGKYKHHIFWYYFHITREVNGY